MKGGLMNRKIIQSVLFMTSLLFVNSVIAEPIRPIQPLKNINPAQVELGKKLFFDPRLSLSGNISCNSCHNLSLGGVDNMRFSIGHNWQKGSINTPTVLNSGLNLAQFWNGRAADLKEQAEGPISNPFEMASNHVLAAEVLSTIPGYVVEFKQVFGDDNISIDRVTTAIAEFEKTLITPNSRFDQWLLGDKTAISDYELSGYQIFKTSGCVACHNGPGVGGQSFQKLGIKAVYETDHPAQGKADVSGKASDINVFKVPLLRNIELTFPYFHDGGAATLEEAVDTMARVQRGLTFSRDENARVVAFLKTLTGDQPSFNIPHLPPSGPNTPKPQPFAEESY